MLPEITDRFRRLLKKGKEDPLIIMSQPVPAKEIWEKRSFRTGAFFSAVIHILILALLLIVFRKQVENISKGAISLILPDRTVYFPTPAVKPGKSGGGGGGGDRSPLPASKGKLPKFAKEQFTPPTPKILNEQPKLAMDPTLVIPPNIQLPNVNMPVYGDPLSRLGGPPSGGPGSGGGTGTGSGGGVGPGTGPGVGPGSGGGIGGGAYKIGGGVSAPLLIKKINPEYSEEARKAKHQGMVELYIEVEPDGIARKIVVLRSLGLGLDEKAIEAVRQWRFKPGLKDGKPVTVGAYVSVNFRLL